MKTRATADLRLHCFRFPQQLFQTSHALTRRGLPRSQLMASRVGDEDQPMWHRNLRWDRYHVGVRQSMAFGCGRLNAFNI